MLAALNAASRAGLLVEEGGLEHRFAHDVIREVVEDDLGAGRRRALHHRVGEALEQLSGTAAELGWHFLEGHAPERALPYLILAGDQAEAVFAHGEAERHYRIALDLSREIGSLLHEGLALEKIGRVLTTTGRYDQALTTLEQALEKYGMASDFEGERRAAARIGATHAHRGAPREGLERIQPLLERLETDEPSPGLADLYLQWARLTWDSGSPSQALTAAERVGGTWSRIG